MISNFLTILKREFTQLAYTAAIYCVLAGMTLFYSFIFYTSMEQSRQSLIQPVSYMIGVLSIFLIPVLTMRSFAGEENSGTIETLFTLPIRRIEILLGKFFGCWLFYLLTLFPLLVYLGIFAYYGEVDLGVAIGSISGLILIGGAQIAVGLLVSSLTSNIIVAASGGCIANFFIFMLSMPIETGSSVYSFPAQLSWWSHFKEIFSRGIIDTRSVTYFISFIVLFLFLIWFGMVCRGEFSRAGRQKLKKGYAFIAAFLALAAVNVFIFAGWARVGWKSLFREISEGRVVSTALVTGICVALLLLSLLAFKLGRASNNKGRGRILQNGWPVWLAAGSAVLIFLNINYLALLQVAGHKTYYRWDITQNQVNTISPKMCEAIDGLEKQINFTVFFSDKADYDGLPLARRLRDLFSEMSAYSPNVKVRFLDAISDSKDARDVGKEMGLPLPELAKLMVIDYNGKRVVLHASSLLRAPNEQEMMSGVKRAIMQAEAALTVAVRSITDQRVVRVYFTQGHGEMTITEGGRNPESASDFATALRREAYAVKPWLLNGEQPVPPGCDILVIAAPKIPFAQKMADVVSEYIERGGRVLLLLPAEAGKTYKTGLEGLLGQAGITVRSDIVVDQKNNYGSQPSKILTLMSDTAPIKTGLSQTVAVLADTPTIRLSEKTAEKTEWKNWPLLRTLKASKRISLRTKKTRPGPATVAVASVHAASGENAEARMVTVASASMVSNLNLGIYSNKSLLVGCSRWLAGRDYNVFESHRQYIDYQLRINEDGLRWSWWLVIVALPEMWLLCALLVWWFRRE